MFLHTLPQQIWFAALVVVCGAAIWRGGRPERAIAIIWTLGWLISREVYDYRNWIDPQWSVLVVDAVLLAVFVGFACRTDRNWLLFAAAFQLLNVVTHAAIIADDGVRARAYVYGLIIWSYLVLAALAVGTWIEWRRVRQAKADA